MQSASSLVRRPATVAFDRVTLVVPPSIFLLDERVFMSLGILRVAAVLERAGIAVEMLDLSGVANFEGATEAYARSTASRVVCLTATTPQMPAAVKIVEKVRGVLPEVRFVLGGPHSTLVHAAARMEKKAGRVARGHAAMAKLEELFDVVVAGDGEEAIFVALGENPPKIVDADDPKTPLFMSSAFYNESPWPARHLMDVESYRYEIDGHKAGNLIAQLGCLAAGTPIRLAGGRDVAVENVRVGDCVWAWEAEGGRFERREVAATWVREAPDLWELEIGKVTLRATSDHPLWTKQGWVTVADLREGDNVGTAASALEVEVQTLSQEVRANTLVQEGAGFLQPQVSVSAAQGRSFATSPEVCQSEMSEACVSQRECDVLQPCVSKSASDAQVPSLQEEVHYLCHSTVVEKEFLFLQMSRRMGALSSAPSLGKGSEVRPCCRQETDVRAASGQHGDRARGNEHTRGTSQAIQDEAWRQKPDEAARSGSESVRYAQSQVGQVFGSSDASSSQRRQTWPLGEWAVRCLSEQAGAEITSASRYRGSDVSVCGQRGVLDRSVCFGQTTQPGLRGYEDAQSDSLARRILALKEKCSLGRTGLRVERVGGTDHLDEGASNSQAQLASRTDPQLRFEKLTSKKFIGASRVYNITVCPGHSYVAGGIVVHNCPFMCSFCGGRNSSMLRRIRTRTTASVVSEIEHLYEKYGFTAAMLHDDELNVNKNVVELMNEIAALQKRLGVEFRFRGFIKAELFNEEQADAMYRAGFRWLLCGFEAAHPRILENIQKKATLADNERVVEICKKHNIKVKALMSVGHAGETEASVLAVRDWLIRVQPSDFDCTVISTYPGTPYYDEAVPHESLPDVWTYTCKKSGDRLHAVDIDYMTVADYYKGIPGEYVSHVFTDHLPAKEIVRLRDIVENEVREKLKIPFNPGAPGIRYEHSMGASGGLPPLILRTSKEKFT
jgi:radical SAM superfamily enzyme YgiQ (UPF0313 family)